MYLHEYRIQCNCSAIPLLSAFPFLIPLWSPFVSPYLLGTLLAVIGSCPPRSQVARKLISPFPSPSPYTPLSKIPTPWGFPELNMHITKTTSQTWLTRSSTIRHLFYTFYVNFPCIFFLFLFLSHSLLLFFSSHFYIFAVKCSWIIPPPTGAYFPIFMHVSSHTRYGGRYSV
jgi:hypothetical protein